MSGRRVPWSSYLTRWRTSPSRGVKPTWNRHFCQRTSCPSTVKLAPSGWVISTGLRSCRGPSGKCETFPASRIPSAV